MPNSSKIPVACAKSRTVGVLIAANDDTQDVLNVCRSQECILERMKRDSGGIARLRTAQLEGQMAMPPKSEEDYKVR